MAERKISDWICTDERINTLSSFEESFFYRLITKADGKGRIDARPEVLKSALYPLKKVTVSDIEKAARKLVHVGLAILYESEGRAVLGVEDWGRYSRIRGTETSEFNDPDKRTELDCGGTRRDAAGRGEPRSPSSPPSPPSPPFFPPTPPYYPPISPLSPVTPSLSFPPCAREAENDGDCGKLCGKLSEFAETESWTREILEKAKEWISYKQERGESCGEIEIKNLVEAISSVRENHEDADIICLMRECMASGYKGIAFDRLEKIKKAADTKNSSSDLKKFAEWAFLNIYGGA